MGLKKPSECLHILIERLPADRPPVLEFNGKGFLQPVLVCQDCGSVLYIINKDGKPKKKSES